MLRIAILTQYPLNLDAIQGGVESSMVGLIRELKNFDDLDLHIITSTKQVNKDKTVSEDTTTFHYIPSPKLPRLITSLTFDQYRVKRKIYEINPDLVHAHMTAPLYGYPALKTGYPTIVTVHGIVGEESKTWRGLSGFIKRTLFVPMENHVLRTAKILTTVSPYVMQKIRRKCGGEIYVIPNGISDGVFKIENNEVSNRLLWVGGIEPRKGLLNLLKAINIIRKEIPSAKLHIIGKVRKRKYFDSLTDYVNENGLKNQVIFKGALSNDELNKEYGECSVFVFPSEEESQGIVLLEAMAAGKPVVATNVGGIPHVLEDNVTGLLVEYGDMKGLANRMAKLLKDEQLRRMYGDNGKERAKLFSNKELSKKYYDLYKECGGNK